MPSSRRLISSTTLSSSAASVTFSSIPAGYTDLVLRMSVRSAGTGTNNQDFLVRPNNNSSTIYSGTFLQANGATALSNRVTNYSFLHATQGYGISDGNTSNTFASMEYYIPNYTAASNKPISTIYVGENNSTTAYMLYTANLFSSTDAISSLVISGSANYVAGSSFYLYGLLPS